MDDVELSEVEAEFAGADFGDKRLDARLVALAKSVAAKPALSFPRALSPAGLEAAYRFLNNVKVTPGAVLRPHVEQTLNRIGELEEVLVAHDSTTISFTSDGSREGLTAARGEKQSFLTHCSLALRADGTRRPEGVLAASYHVPTKSRDGQLQQRWLDHVREVHASGLAPAKTIHLMDREADDYELLDLLMSLGARFVIRVQHNRKLEGGHLRDVAEAAKVSTEREVPLSKRRGKAGPKQRKVHPPRAGRRARLAISSTKVSIHRPCTAASSQQETLELNLVRVWEPNPPEGEHPVEWLLYTNEPVKTAEQMLRVVDWYRARWTIEEYNKALKTGCALEKRQLGDLYALTNATALALPIAWKLLLLKTENLARPEEPATQVLETDELEVLRRIARKPLSDAPTVHEVVYAIAGLGGHLKHNGAPGWQTLAHGYERLHAVLEGYRIGREVEAARSSPS